MASLPEAPDLAIVAIPAAGVLEALNQIGEKGTKNVVVLSAGFKEIGPEGEQLEKTLIETAKKYGLNVIGPNCLGFVNNLCPINATFGQLVKDSGSLRFVSQSGALATSLFDWCNTSGLGFSQFITLGNKAVINENHVLEYFAQSDGPIGLYLESISGGPEFLKIAQEISKKNPIFAIKPGKSEMAAKAMKSHTGAIAGADSVLEKAFLQAGILRCAELEDFFNLARAFAWEKPPDGPKVAVISNAGGPAVVIADAIAAAGLELVEFDPTTHAQLAKILPRTASVLNPVDVLGDALADRYTAAAQIVLGMSQADALVVILTPQLMTQIEKTAESIGNLSRAYKKPIFCSFMGGNMVVAGEKILNQYHIPSFNFPERAVKALSAMWQWNKWRLGKNPDPTPTTFSFDHNRAKEIIDSATQQNRGTLDTLEANEIITAAGITTPRTAPVVDLKQAKDFANAAGWPVVLKLSSPGLIHKTEVGGVIKGINNESQLEAAWDKLEQKIKTLDKEICSHLHIQIQKEIDGGVEVIVGVKRDPTFGPVLLFGAGGTMAELIADRNLFLLPAELPQIKELVQQSKIFPILNGFRGEPPYALDKLYDLILHLGKLVESTPEVSEIEMNPVIVTLNDVWAVDARVILSAGEVKSATSPKFMTATTVTHTILAGKFHYLVFEPEEPLIYQPGQYVSVKVADARINAYSIAGSVGVNKFCLLVDASPGGIGSKFFENLKVNDKILFLGPFGTFTLKADDEVNNLVFLGTGSGISALKNMVESLLTKGVQKDITLYFGLRFPSDVFWKDYFEEMATKYPNFHFKFCLSKPDESWKGNVGHVNDLLKADFPDTKNIAAYLCGNKQMIEETQSILIASGCPKERVYFERFF